MLNFHKDHKSLVLTAILGFLVLSTFIAVMPAYQMQDVQPLPDQPVPTEDELAGLSLYIDEGCVACHTQQVRSIEMDKTWGDRPSLPSDYYYSKQRLDVWRQSPSLLGSERTGPDLTNIGNRTPSDTWHLLHLYNPRTVVEQSVMPSYQWLFVEKNSSEITSSDVTVGVPKTFFNKQGKQIVATQRALDLVAYLKSLKQTPLPGNATPEFIPSSKEKEQKSATAGEVEGLPDGSKLFANTCAVCHQANGKGLKGAFPPLAGSVIVNDNDPEQLIRIVLQGYDARSEYGQMPGFATQLKDEDIAAIATHERSSWGNNAPAVTPEEVKKIRALIEQNM